MQEQCLTSDCELVKDGWEEERERQRRGEEGINRLPNRGRKVTRLSAQSAFRFSGVQSSQQQIFILPRILRVLLDPII